MPPVLLDLPPGLPPVLDPEFEGSLTKFADLPPSGADLFIILKKGPRPGAKFCSMPGSRLKAHQIRILVGSMFQRPTPCRDIILGDIPYANSRNQHRLMGVTMEELSVRFLAFLKNKFEGPSGPSCEIESMGPLQHQVGPTGSPL